MKVRHFLPLVVLGFHSIFAAPTPIGCFFYVKGPIQSIYIKSQDVFFVTIKDSADGISYQSWSNGNHAGLAFLLAAKAQGTSVKMIYDQRTTEPPASNFQENTNYCYDQYMIKWVCKKAMYFSIGD